MSTAYVLTRDLTTSERVYAGTEDLHEGDIVYRCVEPTYGCIGPFGIAATNDPEGGYPFFELPLDALRQESTDEH